jgi:hypothetical protein
MSRPSKRPTQKWLVGLALLGAATLAHERLDAAGPADRLDQFRQLARSHGSADGSPEAYRAMYALLDEEVVESLGAGGLYASPAFLQDRLDAFGEAWGATTVDVLRVGRFVVGAFQMSDVPGANTVRVYGKLGGEAALLTTLSREGRPTVYPWASGPGGAAQFVTAWEGPSTGQGLRPLRLDLIRQEGDGVRVVWSTTDLFPDGLMARAYLVRGDEIRLRYELRYPGWSPGCEGQTESEDLFRASPETGSLVRKSGRPLNGWHRELRATVAELFAALAAKDEASLVRLVPHAQLRRRLPATLRAETACDATDGGAEPRTVSIAATAEHTPWALTFQRGPSRWRLTTAAPVLE